MQQCILLGVEPATQFVTLAGGDAHAVAKTPHLGAVLESPRGAVVPGRQDPFVADQDRTDVTSETRGTFRDSARDLHEVLVPARSGHQ